MFTRPAALIRLLALMSVLAGACIVSTSASAFWNSGTGPTACAPHSDRFDVPGLWLGHFTGGRWDRHANGNRRVEWRNEYQCFFSAHACQAWRAGMRREYARFRGHGTCLALRGGGRPVKHAVRGLAVRY
jgi:hypothetical protein